MRKDKLKFILCIDGITLISGLIFLLGSKFMLDFFPPCVLLTKYGITCPACGGTRCVNYFFTLRFWDSFSMHPIFFLIIVYLILLFVMANCSLFTKRLDKALKVMFTPRVVVAWTILFAIFGIIRGFVLYPF